MIVYKASEIAREVQDLANAMRKSARNEDGMRVFLPVDYYKLTLAAMAEATRGLNQDVALEEHGEKRVVIESVHVIRRGSFDE